MDNQPITSFKDDLEFLSNDYPCRIYFSRYTYGSITHAYEASKTLNIDLRMNIRNCTTADEAKDLGKQLTPYPEWKRVRANQLRGFLAQKFVTVPELKQKLLAIDPEKVIQYIQDKEISDLILDIKKGLS